MTNIKFKNTHANIFPISSDTVKIENVNQFQSSKFLYILQYTSNIWCWLLIRTFSVPLCFFSDLPFSALNKML